MTLPKLNRSDRAFGRAWARAYRAGKPTKEIVANWLAGVRGPEMPQYYIPTMFSPMTTSTHIFGFTNTQLGSLANG